MYQGEAVGASWSPIGIPGVNSMWVFNNDPTGELAPFGIGAGEASDDLFCMGGCTPDWIENGFCNGIDDHKWYGTTDDTTTDEEEPDCRKSNQDNWEDICWQEFCDAWEDPTSQSRRLSEAMEGAFRLFALVALVIFIIFVGVPAIEALHGLALCSKGGNATWPHNCLCGWFPYLMYWICSFLRFAVIALLIVITTQVDVGMEVAESAAVE